VSLLITVSPLPLLTDGTNDVVSLAPPLHQFRDQLWWILEIVVHNNHCVSGAIVQTGGYGQLLTEVSGELDYLV